MIPFAPTSKKVREENRREGSDRQNGEIESATGFRPTGSYGKRSEDLPDHDPDRPWRSAIGGETPPPGRTVEALPRPNESAPIMRMVRQGHTWYPEGSRLAVRWRPAFWRPLKRESV